MADQPHRPASGTTPLTATDLTPLPPYRDDPAQAARDASRGRRRQSEQRREARVDAVARDLAVATSRGVLPPGPVRVSLADELAWISDANVADEVAAHLEERAAAVGRVRTSETWVEGTREDAQRAEQARHDVVRDDPGEPVLGTRLTHPSVLLAGFVLVGIIEVKLTAPSLRVALATSTKDADTLAALVAALPILAAELVGLALGAAFAHMRRVGRVVLALVAASALATAVWGVLELASSRETNTAYGKSLNAAGDTSSSTGGFGLATRGGAAPSGDTSSSTGGFGLTTHGGGAPAGDPARARGAVPVPSGFTAPSRPGGAVAGGRPGATARAASPTAPLKPDLRFIVPLTIAGMLTAAGLSMRSAGVLRHQRWQARLDRADVAWREAREACRQTEAEAVRAAQALDASDLRFGAAAEQEEAIRGRLVARLRAEYERTCLALGVAPRELDLPREVPDQGARGIALRLADPQRAFSTQPIVVPPGFQVAQRDGAAPPQAPLEDQEIPEPPVVPPNEVPPAAPVAPEPPSSSPGPAEPTPDSPLADRVAREMTWALLGSDGGVPAGWASLATRAGDGHIRAAVNGTGAVRQERDSEEDET